MTAEVRVLARCNENAFVWATALMVGSAVAVYLLMRRVGVFRL